jgi:hypothetical protein
LIKFLGLFQKKEVTLRAKKEEKKIMQTTQRFLSTIAIVIVGLLLAACDKLEDGNAINEILPGMWGVSYTMSEEMDVSYDIDHLTFGDDGQCTIVSGEESMTGTYRASDAVIRIDYSYNNEERTMLWRVLSMSPYKIVTEYDFDTGKQTVTATVTLDRIAATVQPQ